MTHQAVSSFLNLLSRFLLVSFRFLVGRKNNLYIITYISVTNGKAKWLINAAHFSNHPLSNFLPPSPIKFYFLISFWFHDLFRNWSIFDHLTVKSFSGQFCPMGSFLPFPTSRWPSILDLNPKILWNFNQRKKITLG